MFDPYRKRREKASYMREKRMGAVDFSLPVDGDVATFRVPTSCAGDMMDSLVADLIKERNPFFDEVCARWWELFPGLSARPGKWVSGNTQASGGKLFLKVGSAAGSFAIRPKLRDIHKRLAALPSAPKHFTIHVEISTDIKQKQCLQDLSKK